MKTNCSIFKRCGGCFYSNESYHQQLLDKTNKIKQLVKKNNLKINVHDIQGSPHEIGYRNKVIVAFNQQYQYGLYEESSHRIVPYDTCLLHEPIMDEILKKIQRMLKKYRVSIYDEKRQRGFLRHVLIRRAVQTDQTMVVLVCNENMMKGSKNFCQELVKAFPSIKTIVMNVNKRKTPIVLGQEEKVLYGKGFIVDELCGLQYKISSKSFYQINHDQCVALYQKALSLLNVKGNEVTIDTYCGIGTIGMTLSNQVKQVIGVELNKDAVKDAKNNARMNKIENIHFINADATSFMKDMAKEKQKVDILIMDPPRSGSTKEFIQATNQLQPKQVVYISCDPTTQVRDLLMFKKYGYVTQDMYLYDMFPYTSHVETVVLLSQQKPDDTIEIDLDLDELYATSAELKATYQEIKDYVLKEFGLKVSNLYISQVKRKCGIEVVENYNLPKSENARVPQCSKEKEEAIKAALKYFTMI